MTYIILADLHLTNGALEEYRWKWLDKFTEWTDNVDDTTIIILGDITENKDRHSEKLVNRFISYLEHWRKSSRVIILTGNHDGVDVTKPYFRFLSCIEDVEMITKPKMVYRHEDKERVWFLPHSKNPVEEWSDLGLEKANYIFMHQAVNEAKTSNEFEIQDSLAADYFSEIKGRVFSGDIHVPQRVNKITYVGSPYPVYFGDNFKGRFIVLDNGKITPIHIPSIRKLKLKIELLKESIPVEFEEGDQVSMEVTLDRTEQYRWSEIRNDIRERVKKAGAILVSLELIVPRSNVSLKTGKRKRVERVMSDKDYIQEYAKKNKLDTFYVDTALEIIKEVSTE